MCRLSVISGGVGDARGFAVHTVGFGRIPFRPIARTRCTYGRQWGGERGGRESRRRESKSGNKNRLCVRARGTANSRERFSIRTHEKPQTTTRTPSSQQASRRVLSWIRVRIGHGSPSRIFTFLFHPRLVKRNLLPSVPPHGSGSPGSNLIPGRMTFRRNPRSPSHPPVRFIFIH